MYQLVDSCVSCRCHAVQNRFPRQFWARFSLRRPTVSPTTSLAVAARMGYDPISTMAQPGKGLTDVLAISNCNHLEVADSPSRCSSCELARPRPWQLPSRQPQLLLRAVQQFLLSVFLHEHRDCSLPGRSFIQPAARKASDLSCLLSSSDVRLCRAWVHAVFMPAVNSAKRRGVRLKQTDKMRKCLPKRMCSRSANFRRSNLCPKFNNPGLQFSMAFVV